MADLWLKLIEGRACIACGINDGTVVPAHRNEGKGMGLKTHSGTVVPLCMRCHQWYDAGPAPRDEKREFWLRNWTFHMLALIEAGLVAPVGYKEPRSTFRRSSKNLPRTAA